MTQLGGYTIELFEKDHCSPISDDHNYSCLDDKLIIKIAEKVNKMIKQDKNNDYEEIDLDSSITDIHNEISKILKKMTGCSSEVCWLSFKKLMSLLGEHKTHFEQSFKPFMPHKWLNDYNTWLRTDDIEKCLGQYQKKHDDFYFYGAVPIDFDNCSVSHLCDIDLQDHLTNGISKIGIVFNTDPHDESGEHWISFYTDIHGKNLNGIPGIYYYDSYGNKPPNEVEKLISKLKGQGEKINKKFKYFYNDTAHQKENYQCGMYCIHFIKEMIKGTNFQNFVNRKLTDDLMLNKRKEYFISPQELKYNNNNNDG